MHSTDASWAARSIGLYPVYTAGTALMSFDVNINQTQAFLLILLHYMECVQFSRLFQLTFCDLLLFCAQTSAFICALFHTKVYTWREKAAVAFIHIEAKMTRKQFLRLCKKKAITQQQTRHCHDNKRQSCSRYSRAGVPVVIHSDH